MFKFDFLEKGLGMVSQEKCFSFFSLRISTWQPDVNDKLLTQPGQYLLSNLTD